jgi:predicted porin
MGNTFYSANALRVDNAIAYQSPKWGGFQAGIGYSMNIAEAEKVPSGLNTSAFFSAVNWTGGPFFVAVTYDVANQADSTPQKQDQKHLQIGGTFDIGAFRLHAAYADQSNVGAISTVLGGSGAFLAVPAGLQFDNTAWMLGATWTMGAFKVFGSYQVADADGQKVGTVNYEPDYSIWGIGATYNLSRRTNLYASYASRDADGTLAGNAFNAKQLALGMRHLF